MDDMDPTVPDLLRPLLGAAAELELEHASDGFWPDEPTAHRAKREDIMHAARVIDRWETDASTREAIVRLARVAVGEQEPGRWPRTIEEAEDLLSRAALTRDLILLRDVLDGKPTQEEPDEPE
jgi:hypothetical protein